MYLIAMVSCLTYAQISVLTGKVGVNQSHPTPQRVAIKGSVVVYLGKKTHVAPKRR